MMQPDDSLDCRDCGEPIITSPLSAKLGMRATRCDLCHARFIAAYSSFLLAVGFVLSFPGELWAVIVAGFFVIWAAFWMARCGRVKYPELASQILSRGLTALMFIAFAVGIFLFAVSHQRLAMVSMVWPEAASAIVLSWLVFSLLALHSVVLIFCAALICTRR
jgi:hypothetical protein